MSTTQNNNTVDNLGRFHIARDLQDWLGEGQSSITKDSTESARFSETARKMVAKLESVPQGLKRDYLYTGDEIFAQYNRVQTEGIPLIQKHYPDIDIFLKNIYWSEIQKSLNPYAIDFGKTLFKQYKAGKKILSITHLFPLEMVFFGEALRSLGYKNIAYNFNRNASINSSTKTFEADLFLLSYEYLPWLKKQVTDFAKSIQDSLPSDFAGLYFLFQENDSAPNWTLNSLDPYILSAIGWKKPRVTYRLEEYPTSEWFAKNGFTDVVLIDSDSTRGFDTHFIEVVKKVVKTHQETIELKNVSQIGYFEEYISLVNKEYLLYKKSRIETIESSEKKGNQTVSEDPYLWPPASKQSSTSRNISYNRNNQENRFSPGEKVIALGSIIVMLMMFYLIANKNTIGTSGTTTSGGGGGWGGSWGGGSSWGSSSSSSNTSISGGKSSSSISSFGGGGFSKGSGG